MAVPNNEQFAEWIQLAEQEHRPDVSALPQDGSLTQAQAIDFLVAAHAEAEKYGQRLLEHPVARWLTSQNAFQCAESKIEWSRGKLMAEADYRQHLLAAVPRYMEQSPSIRSFRRRVENAARYVFTESFTAHSVAALAEYFSGAAAKSIVSTQRTLSEAAAKLDVAMDRYLGVIQEVQDSPAAGLWPSLSTVRRLLREAKQCGLGPTKDSLLLERLSGQPEVRVLVYRMYCINMRLTGLPKPDAIAEMMRVEGIASPLSSRRIEELCSEFTERREAARRPLSRGMVSGPEDGPLAS
jgi:hypothetical protein